MSDNTRSRCVGRVTFASAPASQVCAIFGAQAGRLHVAIIFYQRCYLDISSLVWSQLKEQLALCRKGRWLKEEVPIRQV